MDFPLFFEDEVEHVACVAVPEIPAPYGASGISAVHREPVPGREPQNVQRLSVGSQGMAWQRGDLIIDRLVGNELVHLPAQPPTKGLLHDIERYRIRVLAGPEDLLSLGQDSRVGPRRYLFGMRVVLPLPEQTKDLGEVVRALRTVEDQFPLRIELGGRLRGQARPDTRSVRRRRSRSAVRNRIRGGHLASIAVRVNQQPASA